MPLPASRTAPGAPPRARLLVRLLAVLAVVLGTALAAPAPQARAAVTLTRVTDFGTNPGALTMYVHRPATLPAHPPVVVALHGCTQSAQVYADNSGLPQLADQDGFLLVLAETSAANNPSRCFNWFQSGDNRRGQGEALSVRQMVSHAVTAYGADPRRVYVTGLSAGGAMTAVMLATYPDVFSAGAVVAGLPYDCTRDNSPYTCMNPGVDLSPADWAQRVRDASPRTPARGRAPRSGTATRTPPSYRATPPNCATSGRPCTVCPRRPPGPPPSGPTPPGRTSTWPPTARSPSRSTGSRASGTAPRSTPAPAANSAAAPAPRTSSTRSAPAAGSPGSSAWTPPAPADPAIPAPATRVTAGPPPAGRRATTPRCRPAGPPPAAAPPTPRDPARTWACTTRSSPTP